MPHSLLTAPSPTACISRALRDSISSSSSPVHAGAHAQQLAIVPHHWVWIRAQKHILQGLLLQQINKRHQSPGSLLSLRTCMGHQNGCHRRHNASQMLRAVHLLYAQTDANMYGTATDPCFKISGTASQAEVTAGHGTE